MIEFACPVCHNELDQYLKCTSMLCDFIGEFKDGLYHLHRNDETWQKCLGQIEAVKRADIKFKEEYSNKKPPSNGNNINSLMFDKIMEILRDIKGMTFLEIGGQTGWATKKFISRGADLGVNLDITKENMSPTEDRYISVLGDGYYLPFADKQFDFVFDCAALHHFEDKVAMLKEARRVTKDGGFYVSQGNPPRDHEIDDDRKRYMDDFGLIETMPTQEEYEEYFLNSYKNINFVNVGTNMVMWAKKQEVHWVI